MNSTSKYDEGEGIALTGEAIVCLSSIDWDFIWQAPQELMARLAAAGNTVLYIENTGIRTPTLKDLPRLRARLRNYWSSMDGFREATPNLVVLSPILLPFPNSPICIRVNSWLIQRSIAKWLSVTKRGSPIFWTFLPTPLAHSIAEGLDPALLAYFCGDDYSKSSPGAGWVAASESHLLKRADTVFVTSRSLEAAARRHRNVVHRVPCGVDFAKFSSPAKGMPSDLDGVPHPRIGFVGALTHKVDQDLLAEAARLRPRVEFVLVGPVQTNLARLEDLPNVRILGERPHDQLPAYLSAFDAAIIPYKVDEFTAAIYPAKLNEYLAAGLPVISTALPEVVEYGQVHPRTVAIARDGAEFARCLDEAICSASEGRSARVEAARGNDWENRMRVVASALADGLRTRRGSAPEFPGLVERMARAYEGPARRLAAFVAAGYLLLCWTPLPWFVGSWLRLPSPSADADAIVVLAAGVGEGGDIGVAHEERVGKAIELYKGSRARKVILCSGVTRTFDELEVMGALAKENGIADADLVLEPIEGGTYEMLAAAERAMRATGTKSALLVSSPYHMRRASLVWKKLAPDLALIPAEPARNRFYGIRAGKTPAVWRWRASLRQVRGLAHEFAAIAYYRLRGRL